MTISADYAPGIDIGNGVTTTFPVNFPFGAKSDLLVTLNTIATGLDVSPAPVLNGAGTYDYAVSGTPNADTGIYPNGTVTFNTAPPSTMKVVRARATPQRQNVSLTNNGPFPAKTVEGAFDRDEMQLQERSDTLTRAVRAPAVDGVVNMVLPAASARGGYFLAFDVADGHARNSAFSEAQIGALLAGGALVPSTSKSVYTSVVGSLALADAAAFALGGELVIDTAISVIANTTLQSPAVRFVNGGKITHTTFTLTFPGAVIADPRSQIFDTAATGLVTMKNGAISAMWFGAVPDDATDSANPLLQWQNALDAAVTGTGAAKGYLPGGGTLAYVTSTPIRFYGSMIGDGSNFTIIKPKAAYASAYIIDFNFGSMGKELRGFTIDLRSLGTGASVGAFGSSSTFGGGGSSVGLGSDISVLSSSLATPAVKAKSTGAEPGMFTGWLFDSMQISAPMPMEIGQNQDDWEIAILRLAQVSGATGQPVDISGASNAEIGGVYLAAANVSGSGNGRSLIQLGKNNRVRRLFVEGSTNAAWLIAFSSSEYLCAIDDLQTNLAYTGADPDHAMFRLPMAASAQKGMGVRLGDYRISAGSLPYDLLFSMFCGTNSAVGPIVITLEGIGWERWASVPTAFAFSASGGTANANKIWKLRGNYSDVTGQWEAPHPSVGNLLTWTPVAQPGSWTNR